MRVLRKSVDTFLKATLFLEVVLLSTLDNFDMSAIPYIVIWVGVISINAHVVFKYGRKEDDND